MSFGGFALLGSDGEETRVLVHEATGFAAAIPGVPSAAAGRTTSPASDVVVTLAALPIEIAYRMDRIDTGGEAEPLAIALVLAFANDRAAKTPHGAPVRGALLPVAADAGATATYAMRGDDARAMESVAVAIRRTSDASFAVYRTARFRTGETNPLQWIDLRTAMAHAQDWTGAMRVPPRLWPDGTLALPSAALELTEDAFAEAQAKAAELASIADDDQASVTEALLELPRTDDAPTHVLHPTFLQHAARQIAMRLPSQLAEVLLRNYDQVVTAHDFRAWCWQCIWAIGNRAGL